MLAAIILRERNMKRFLDPHYDESWVEREIDVHMHARGRNLKAWQAAYYTLHESLSWEEKVVLVGYNLCGLNVGVVMEKYPQKMYVVVFLASCMPDSFHIYS